VLRTTSRPSSTSNELLYTPRSYHWNAVVTKSAPQNNNWLALNYICKAQSSYERLTFLELVNIKSVYPPCAILPCKIFNDKCNKSEHWIESGVCFAIHCSWTNQS
jgi:hypothetical protein